MLSPRSILVHSILTAVVALTIGYSLSACAQTIEERLEASPRHLEWVTISTEGGDSFSAFVAHPESNVATSSVVVIHDIRAMSTWIRLAADELAEARGRHRPQFQVDGVTTRIAGVNHARARRREVLQRVKAVFAGRAAGTNQGGAAPGQLAVERQAGHVGAAHGKHQRIVAAGVRRGTGICRLGYGMPRGAHTSVGGAVQSVGKRQ